MFAEHTVQSIIALACLDRGVTDREKDDLQMVLIGKSPRDCAVVKYKDAAKRLGLSLPQIKMLAKDGKLKKVYGQGTRKAMGVTEESLRKLAS